MFATYTILICALRHLRAVSATLSKFLWNLLFLDAMLLCNAALTLWTTDVCSTGQSCVLPVCVSVYEVILNDLF